VLSALDVILFNQVRSLTTIETRNDVKGLVVKSYCCVEIPACIQTGNLSPSVAANIVNFAFVHRLRGKRATYRINPRARSACQDRSQGVGPPLEDHIPALLQPFIDELVATFGCFTWFTSASQENATLFVFN